MRSMLVLVLCLTACGTEETPERAKPTDTPFSMCKVETEGVCIIEYSTHMNIDYARLSRYFALMEYEVNYYYPGLDFATLAAEQNFVLNFEWADYNTTFNGEYADYSTEARVYLRRGEAITPRMECADRYIVALHEALHFVADRYLNYQYAPGEDPHLVPHFFNRWAFFNDADLDTEVEGRMNNWIMRDCPETE